ncbi:hypothetical protein NC797_07715 [Aquibacillus sp. 3ASR75-11]|uniref:Uncharacterized protein n=1 Tax=Terrihalobacillus insolitus TaxID=2950438 RepID=A0A9X3WT66_9BACI|nr:hypothetical protein [Terrihalobacillus insolitus]MDC3424393.1 hypothetical protein [Terrihalobacillus insolitus]
MNSAILHNGQVITAREYNTDVHGTRLFCIDKSCKVPVIFVPGNENVSPYFKTTGKHDSKHNEGCGFYKPLTFVESVKKVEEYQGDLLDKGMKETLVRINLNKLDPDYESKVAEREQSDKKKQDPSEVKIKQDNETPSSISSLKSIVKLMVSYEPDVLSSILVNVKGQKVPISSLIVDQEKAHNLLWKEEMLPKVGYFVYGVVDAILRRERVIYINFKPVNNVLFSLMVFDRYFKHFTYTDEELMGKNILAWGHLSKNTYNDKNTTEMAIKSDKYIEFLK